MAARTLPLQLQSDILHVTLAVLPINNQLEKIQEVMTLLLRGN